MTLSGSTLHAEEPLPAAATEKMGISKIRNVTRMTSVDLQGNLGSPAWAESWLSWLKVDQWLTKV